MELNKIYNENCLYTIQNMIENNVKCNIILTSPPYNTSYHNKHDPYMIRYGEYDDKMSNEEYIEKTKDWFKGFDTILAENGVILYNLSYSVRNSSTFIKTISHIIEETNFDLVDTIVWKKNSCIPDNRSSNRLSRIVEFVFVLVRKNEIKTFQSNKEIINVAKSGAKNYNPIMNFIEAKNNDGVNKLNKATYSTELCDKLLSIYAKENDIVYDPFMGTGTTAISALKNNCKFIGSEIDLAQCEYAEKRIGKIS